MENKTGKTGLKAQCTKMKNKCYLISEGGDGRIQVGK